MRQKQGGINIDQKAIDRFWSKVNRKGPDDCWNWLASTFEDGYGQFKISKKNFQSHRLAMIFTLGRMLPSTEWVLHKCDNPICCNPNHLWLGTAKDNAEDMVNKGRSLRGEKSPASKLTEESVLEIIRLWKTGKYTKCNLAKTFKVSNPLIGLIVRRKYWTYLTEKMEQFSSKTDRSIYSLKGEDVPMSKLKVEEVRKIRKMWGTGKYMKKTLAIMFGVSPHAIYSIIVGKSWRSLDA